MTVQHEEAIATAAHTVHDDAWFRYWKEGEKELNPDQVIDSIRKVRVGAHVKEEQLPSVVLELLKEARQAQHDHKVVRLARLIETLKVVYLPPRPSVD